MSRRTHTFKQSDLVRALRAAQKAGLRVAVVEIEGGKIVIRSAPSGSAPGNVWDVELTL